MTTQQILTAARDARRAVGVSGTEQRNRALLGIAAAPLAISPSSTNSVLPAPIVR